MATALTPPAVVMIFSSDAGIQAMGISLVLVSLLMAGLILNSFAQTVSGLKLQQELEYLAETDVLKGLSNRRAFNARLEEEIQIAENDSEAPSFSVMMIDLDGFKGVNDAHGHVAGDELLCEVSKRLQKICGHARSIARLGGDEFAVILVTDNDIMLKHQAAAIRTMLSMPYQIDGKQVSISASVGIAGYPKNGQETTELLKCADQALYQDKFSDSKSESEAAKA